MTEAEYATFASDPHIAGMTSVIGVALSDGTSWTWRVEKDVVDPSGKAHAAGGMSMSSSDTYEFDGGVKITLTPGTTVASPGGNPRGLVTLVDSRKITSCVFSQTGQPDRTCTLATRAPIVVRR